MSKKSKKMKIKMEVELTVEVKDSTITPKDFLSEIDFTPATDDVTLLDHKINHWEQNEMKTIRKKCSECGCSFSQEVTDYGTRLSKEDYDEFCPDCNMKASR